MIKELLRTSKLIGFTSILLFACLAPELVAIDNSVPEKVLFVGNSYTAQIKSVLGNMLKHSAYKDTTFEFITKGGAKLAQHSVDTKTLERIKSGGFDLVVLQDQSQTPALSGSYAKSFHESVKVLSRVIKDSGGEVVLYMTWGRLDGDKQNKHLFPDYETMQEMLSDAYEKAAKKNKTLLAPVGEVWSRVRNKDEALGRALYKGDGSHPSAKGALLAPAVFFRVMFDDSLESVKYEGIMNASEWGVVKEAALRVKSKR
tara:strand:- start:601 stop:1374 length:774 start_codon:yes stop_codon:yes gene_type:complete